MKDFHVHVIYASNKLIAEQSRRAQGLPGRLDRNHPLHARQQGQGRSTSPRSRPACRRRSRPRAITTPCRSSAPPGISIRRRWTCWRRRSSKPSCCRRSPTCRSFSRKRICRNDDGSHISLAPASTRRRVSCPLPLRERAAAAYPREEWVRGHSIHERRTPHPSESLHLRAALSRKGRGRRNRRCAHGMQAMTAQATPRSGSGTSRTSSASRATRNSCSALQHTSLDIARGELLCLIGPSGCGKSTLLNMIGGLLTPTTGTVEVARQAGARAAAARHRLRVPGERAVSLVHDHRERQARHGVPGRAEGRAGAARAQGAGGGRTRGFHGPLSGAAFRRHAPARGAGARAEPANRHRC